MHTSILLHAFDRSLYLFTVRKWFHALRSLGSACWGGWGGRWWNLITDNIRGASRIEFRVGKIVFHVCDSVSQKRPLKARQQHKAIRIGKREYGCQRNCVKCLVLPCVFCTASSNLLDFPPSIWESWLIRFQPASAHLIYDTGSRWKGQEDCGNTKGMGCFLHWVWIIRADPLVWPVNAVVMPWFTSQATEGRVICVCQVLLSLCK